MDGIRLHDHACSQDALHIEIALCGRSRSDTDRLVRKKCVERVPVRLGVNGNCLDPHLPACPDDPNGDLAAVCD